MAKKGQEWEKHEWDKPAPGDCRVTRIRLASEPHAGRVDVESLFTTALDSVARWGRRRSLLVSALSHMPSGYRLVRCEWGHPDCFVNHPMSPDDVKAVKVS
jgi:hypothetical protein